MSEEVLNSLIITSIGMGLVFFAIIVLWGIMEAMVRFFPEKANHDLTGSTPVNQKSHGEIVEEIESLKPIAAAAAVAIAMAQRKQRTKEQSSQSIHSLSPWQSVMRANRLQQQNSPYTRKYKGIHGNENKS
jgi:Na+-transporting methylmalonyl-CoA/oxaloacetate decarboxylase gamma subunit